MEPHLCPCLLGFWLLGWPGLSIRPCLREWRGGGRCAVCARALAEKRAARRSLPGTLVRAIFPVPPGSLFLLQDPSSSSSPRLETDGLLQPRRPTGCQGLGHVLWRPGCWGSPGFPGVRPLRTDESPSSPAVRFLVQGAKRRSINFSVQKSMLLSGWRSMPSQLGPTRPGGQRWLS